MGFKQYNPSKPAKYGLHYRSLSDTEVPHTYFTLPYAGKPNELDGKVTKYYVTGTVEYTKYLVTQFIMYNDIYGCSILMDQYFTSVATTTIFGTMKLNWKGIPRELRSVGKREAKSTYFIYNIGDKRTIIVSNIDKKMSWMKNVMLLTTMHDKKKVKQSKCRKSQVHVMYDHTKGGVDVVDLLSTMHSTRTKCKRWPINTLAFLLDTARTNGKTILKDNGAVKSKFTYELGKSLCLPRRYHQRIAGL